MDEMRQLRMYAERLAGASAKIDPIVEKWSARTFTGAAAEGGVVATVDAAGTLVALDISALGKRRNDGIALADAVVAAVEAAEGMAAQAKAEMMDELVAATGHRLGSLLGDAQRDFEARAHRRPDHPWPPGARP
ncbi:YbaB/EbfC family nucleoid-associated protein [Nonomuraea sp. NPDC059023]|uniref:YbaB/EbfC family nucleoid-associated protein n=1 Tax=unclassified Nonomuraea TaxID=2593643 RepID=UPI00369B580F